MSAKGPTKTPLHLMVNASVILFFVVLSQYTLNFTWYQLDHIKLELKIRHALDRFAYLYVMDILSFIWSMYLRMWNIDSQWETHM